ncbi:MAG TPA: hypothetical protein DEB57_11755, partial [Microbacterium sp.]|nr:hypothetical protein [Microbacterium sp.]
MRLNKILVNLGEGANLARDVGSRGDLRALASMLGPAFRGLVLQRGKGEALTSMKLDYAAAFDWRYRREFPAMA